MKLIIEEEQALILLGCMSLVRDMVDFTGKEVFKSELEKEINKLTDIIKLAQMYGRINNK